MSPANLELFSSIWCDGCALVRLLGCSILPQEPAALVVALARTSFDPDATMFLDTKRLQEFLLALPSPLGLKDENEPPRTAMELRAFISTSRC